MQQSSHDVSSATFKEIYHRRRWRRVTESETERQKQVSMVRSRLGNIPTEHRFHSRLQVITRGPWILGCLAVVELISLFQNGTFQTYFYSRQIGRSLSKGIFIFDLTSLDLFKSLTRKREILFGIHPVREALTQRRRDLFRLFLRRDYEDNPKLNQLADEARQLNLAVEVKDTRELDRLTSIDKFNNFRPHQGVCLDCR